MAERESFTQKLLRHYRLILNRDGDQALRQTLWAERSVTSYDRQMTPEARTAMLDALDQIEKELLPLSRGPSDASSPKA